MDYNYILDIKKIEYAYSKIKKNTKHKNKVLKYEIFYLSNCATILKELKNKTYKHGKYNIFLIKEPKLRVIMSEQMNDKIVNHLVSYYILFPLIEPKLIDMNVATRKNKGSSYALLLFKKYINNLKINNTKIYILKCDISKYFYSIDHQILLEKLKKVIKDNDNFNLIKNIIESTDDDYVNRCLTKYQNVPLYIKGKGLPIGNMTSQILAIFYLNDLDHYIKEKLKIKHYIRYMDDFILIHPSKNYLKYCKNQIKIKLEQLKLKLNSKTNIYDIQKGIIFLSYKFILKKNKLYTLLNPKFKRKLNKKIKKVKNKKDYLYKKYNGYLKNINSNNYIFRTCNKYYKYQKITKDTWKNYLFLVSFIWR